MKTQSFNAAGWTAAAAVAAFVVEIIVTFASELPTYSEIISPSLVAFILAIHIAFGSYATYCLRAFLNERYEFHGADSLIPLLVGGGIVFGLALIGSRLVLDATLSMVLMFSLGIPLGVISMLFGYRLLTVNSTISGYKKPFAYSHIIAPICFLSVVLAPIGLLLLIVAETLLVLMFFSNESPELEFV
jgi:hypothetical protein